MSKCAISVTLTADNLLWLRGQARAAGARSLSAVLDGVIAAARSSGRVHEAAIRSVVGSVQIDAADPQLRDADAMVRKLFPRKVVAETAAGYRAVTRPDRRRRRPPR